MAPAYQYRKVYVDLLTPGGELLVVYLNYVCLGGSWTARAGLEHYDTDGRRSLAHCPAAPALVHGATPVGDLPLAMELPAAGVLPAGRFSLELEVVLGAWEPPEPCPAPDLHWVVRAARTQGRARLGDRTWEGQGYVDYVQIDRPTRQLGLQRLRWGRVHLPDRTVILEHLEASGGRAWHTGVSWTLGASTGQPLHAPGSLDGAGRGEQPTPDGLLRIAPSRELHRGDAFDPERVPRRVDRWACRVVGGPTHEIRWLGTASLGEQSGPALYEEVRFG